MTTVALLSGSILYVYAATSDDRTLARLTASIAAQQQISTETLSASVLLMDKPISNPPKSLVRAFDTRFAYQDPFVSCAETGRAFCLSKFRNASFRIAREAAVEWLFLCDADTVVARPPDLLSGQTYLSPDVYWQRAPEETLQMSLHNIASEGQEAFSKGNSWFIIHKDIFNTIEFNENIYGYGYEDLEFNTRVLASGHVLARSGAQVIHRYHPEADRRINERQYARNKSIYEAAVIATRAGLYSRWQNVEIVDTVHPEWVEFMWLDRARWIAIHSGKKAIGRYRQKRENVEISWDSAITDVFVRDGNRLRFVGREG